MPVRSPLGTFGLEICGAPVLNRYRYTCRCGHVVDRGTCERHEPVDGDVGCRLCLLVDYHNCPMTFERIEPAA
ncbi:MAG TPA: hypothetical protein VFF43_16335 [Caldimonas sp.]|nr:hypothetical protein [Caldimonas sp.]